jgi:hypothetical protein
MENKEYGNPTPIYQYLVPEKKTESGYEGWAIITDPEAGVRPVHEYRLCLIPSKGGDKFAIFYCSEQLVIPDGSALLLAEEMTVFAYGGYVYLPLLCRMVPPNSVDQYPSDALLTFPEEYQGKRLPVTECQDEELLNLLMNVSTLDPKGIEDSSTGGIIERVRSWFG